MLSERIRMSMAASEGDFPSQEPTDYELMETVVNSETWTAPESGYFQVEVFGASGSGGGFAYCTNDDGTQYFYYTGGGGGGGGYAASRFKLFQGDTLSVAIGTVGATTSVTPNNTTDESYDTMSVTGGGNGGNAYASYGGSSSGGAGGAGGAASGGNITNANGNNGSTGAYSFNKPTRGALGGAAGYTGGNAGGNGGGYTIGPEAGKAGFVKIYRGNTNLA